MAYEDKNVRKISVMALIYPHVSATINYIIHFSVEPSSQF